VAAIVFRIMLPHEHTPAVSPPVQPPLPPGPPAPPAPGA
jgi:hypothetical protein